MTLALIESLKRVANVQLRFAPSLSGTLGADLARDMTEACQELLKALDDEPVEEKPSGIFGERMFKTKKRVKKTA